MPRSVIRAEASERLYLEMTGLTPIVMKRDGRSSLETRSLKGCGEYAKRLNQ